MLLRQHGASMLGSSMRRPIPATMTSFSGTSNLAADAMKSVAAVITRPPTAMARPVPQSRNRVWNPTHGIVFGNGELSMTSEVLRTLNTSSPSAVEQDLAVHSNTENLYVLSNQRQSRFPNLDSSQDVAATNDEDSCWAPSIAPQSSSAKYLASEEKCLADAEVISGAKESSDIQTPLSFQMPQEALERAKAAPLGSPESFWTHRLYVGRAGQNVKVHYCKSKYTSERILKEYFLGKDVLGFDIEWKPDSTKYMGIKKNVALVQLASEERIGLFHIALFAKDGVDDLVAPSLKTIMEDPKTTKTGVAIKADCTRLRKFLNIDSKGIFELSHLYKLVKYSSTGDYQHINKMLVNLSKQVEEHLSLPLFKGDVRSSDWTQALTKNQILYAAADSYAGFMLYDVLELKRKQLDPTPPRPYHAELGIPIRLASGVTIATADEAVEETEPETSIIAARSSTGPATALEASTDDIQIEQDVELAIVTKIKSMSDKPKDLPVVAARDQSVISAETWVREYRTSHPVKAGSSPTSCAGPSALRTYAIWRDNPLLSVSEIAALLRDPPLATSTVRAYILDTVRLESLPYDRDRLRALLETVPEEVRNSWRYRSLWRAVQGWAKSDKRSSND